MPPERLAAHSFSPDTREFLVLLHKHGVRYVIVGGEAVIFHGYARLTGDVDFFYDAEERNAKRLFATLREFWAEKIPGVMRWEELCEDGLILQFGRPPNRIDLVNRIDGVIFAEAWPARKRVLLRRGTGTVPLYYLGLQHLIANKRAAARPKDLVDLQFLASRRKSAVRKRRGRHG